MIVEIDGNDIKTIEDLGYSNFTEEKDSKIVLKRKNGKCVFLMDDNRCGIHVKHGYDYKPKICRRFPDNENGFNQIVCGRFSDDISSSNKIKEFEFLYKNRKISSDVLSYAISKLGENYEDDWYTILAGIRNNKEFLITKNDIDRFITNKDTMSKLEKIRLSMILAAYSRNFYYSLISIGFGFKTSLRFPCETIAINKLEYNNINLDKEEIIKFIEFLSKGNGFIYKPNFPEHLLFCLAFLKKFSKQIAFNNNHNKAEFIDMVNAFSILNSVLRFRK